MRFNVLCAVGVFVWSATNARAACKLYPIHPLAAIPYTKLMLAGNNCRHELTHLDQNGDGIADWSASLDHVENSWLVPLDPDIDGDGIVNILDSDPFDRKIGDRRPGFPEHLLYGPLGIAGGRNKAVNAIQLKLWKSTGLYAVNSRSWHSEENLQAIMEIWGLIRRFAAPDKLQELRYVIADDSILDHGINGYYSRDLQALIVARPRELGNSTSQKQELQRQIWRTMSHEIGHAFAFSSLSPRDLVEAATQIGPWLPQADISFLSFFAPLFFKSHWLFSAPITSLRGFQNIPSRYSLQNIHEWFAECFSSTMIDLAGNNSPRDEGLRPVTPAFRHWLMSKFQQVSH